MLTEKELKRVEKEIRRRVEAFLESGHALNSGHTYVDRLVGSCGCLLAAVNGIMDKVNVEDSVDAPGRIAMAAKELKISVDAVKEIEFGYMYPSYYPITCSLGARIRRDYYVEE